MESLNPISFAGGRRSVWIGLSLAIALDTAGPLLWKGALMTLPTHRLSAVAIAALHQPLFAVAGVLLIVQFLNWMSVLSMADVSYAQPITALSYVTVTLLAAAIFHERLTATHLAGIFLILAGVWLISGTPHQSPPVPAAAPEPLP